MTKSLAILAAELTDTYSSDRRVALLDGLLSSQTFTFSGTTLTAPLAHKLVVGSRIRASTTGVLPPELTPNTEYFVRSTPLATTMTVSGTIDGAAISLTGGSGTHSFTEQQLSAEDSIPVLVNHELSHPNYARSTYTVGTCVASPANNDARSTDQFRNITVTTGNPTLSYRHILLIRGGNLTIGNTTGDRHQLETEPSIQAVATLTTKAILLRVRRTN